MKGRVLALHAAKTHVYTTGNRVSNWNNIIICLLPSAELHTIKEERDSVLNHAKKERKKQQWTEWDVTFAYIFWMRLTWLTQTGQEAERNEYCIFQNPHDPRNVIIGSEQYSILFPRAEMNIFYLKDIKPVSVNQSSRVFTRVWKRITILSLSLCHLKNTSFLKGLCKCDFVCSFFLRD